MRDVTEDNTFMRSSQSDASGFIMVVLIIVMGIGAVWLTVAVPNSRQRATREKEAELLFRGRQYVRALSLYERKNGPGAKPPSVDVLVDNKFLRKKYKDPITNDDFVPLFTSSAPVVPGQVQGGGQNAPGRVAGPGGNPSSQVGNQQQGRAGTQGGAQPGVTGQGGRAGQAGQAGNAGSTFGGQIVGVVSKSTAASIMLFNGATHYNEWQFVYQGGSAQQGGGQQGPGGANGRGGQQGGPGGVGPGVGFGAGRGVPPGGPGGGVQGPGRGGAPTPVPGGAGRGRGGH